MALKKTSGCSIKLSKSTGSAKPYISAQLNTARKGRRPKASKPMTTPIETERIILTLLILHHTPAVSFIASLCIVCCQDEGETTFFTDGWKKEKPSGKNTLTVLLSEERLSRSSPLLTLAIPSFSQLAPCKISYVFLPISLNTGCPYEIASVFTGYFLRAGRYRANRPFFMAYFGCRAINRATQGAARKPFAA